MQDIVIDFFNPHFKEQLQNKILKILILKYYLLFFEFEIFLKS